MELKPNMYVRTKNGEIHKCVIIHKDNTNSTLDRFMNEWGNMIMFDEISKASHNIIDLIEVGDYVNGYRVDFVENIDSPIITIKKVFCEEYTKDLYSKTFNIKDIKSIVTKECFSNMEYKVNE